MEVEVEVVVVVVVVPGFVGSGTSVVAAGPDGVYTQLNELVYKAPD